MKSEQNPKPAVARASVSKPGIVQSSRSGIATGYGTLAIFDRPDDWTSLDDFLIDATLFGRRMRCRPMDAFDADNPGDALLLIADNDNGED